MGGAILTFYSSLVDLLGRCAPEAEAIKSGRSDSIRARSILRSLVSMEDLEGVLGLRFILPIGQPIQGGESKSLGFPRMQVSRSVLFVYPCMHESIQIQSIINYLDILNSSNWNHLPILTWTTNVMQWFVPLAYILDLDYIFYCRNKWYYIVKVHITVHNFSWR